MVIFKESDHSYTDIKTNERLCSVTQRIKQFEKPYDENYWSEYKAKEYGESQETVLRYWEYLRTVSSIKGTLVHLFLENLWNGKIIDIHYPKYIDSLRAKEFIEFHTKTQKCLKLAKRFFLDYYETYETISTEPIVRKGKYAGQVDLIVNDLSINRPRIIDYKTDKEIDYDNTYENFTDFLSHLPKSRYHKYCLQTNMYKQMLDYETALPIVVWINENNDSYKLINVEDYSVEAKKLLEC